MNDMSWWPKHQVLSCLRLGCAAHDRIVDELQERIKELEAENKYQRHRANGGDGQLVWLANWCKEKFGVENNDVIGKDGWPRILVEVVAKAVDERIKELETELKELRDKRFTIDDLRCPFPSDFKNLCDIADYARCKHTDKLTDLAYEQTERIKELEAGDYTKVLCEVFSCRYCNEGICAHTSIHLKGCTIDADNIVACSEYCES